MTLLVVMLAMASAYRWNLWRIGQYANLAWAFSVAERLEPGKPVLVSPLSDGDYLLEPGSEYASIAQ